jgi:hypothetical protein
MQTITAIKWDGEEITIKYDKARGGVVDELSLTSSDRPANDFLHPWQAMHKHLGGYFGIPADEDFSIVREVAIKWAGDTVG